MQVGLGHPGAVGCYSCPDLSLAVQPHARPLPRVSEAGTALDAGDSQQCAHPMLELWRAHASREGL